MKRLALFFVLFMFSILSADVFQWQENGRQLIEAQNVTSNSITKDANGNIYLAYDKAINGERSVFLQKFDSNFNPLWGENGIRLTLKNGAQTEVTIKLLGNYIFAVWKGRISYQNYAVGMYAQKIDLNGNLMWGSYGIKFFEGNKIYKTDILPDGNDGIYIFMKMENLYATHLLSTGAWADGWGANGIEFTQYYAYNSYPFPDSDKVTIIYQNNNRVLMQKICSDASLHWQRPRILFDSYSIYKISQTINGNFIITYRKEDYEHRIAYVNNEGNVIWDRKLSSFSTHNVNLGVTSQVVSSTNEIFCLTGGGKLFKTNSEGYIDWILSVEDYYSDTLIPELLPDENGGVYLIFSKHDIQNSIYKKIYLQHFDTNGNRIYPENGKIIYDENYKRLYSVFRNQGKIFINFMKNYFNRFKLSTLVIDENDQPVYQEPPEILNWVENDYSEKKVIANYQNEPVILFSDINTNVLYESKVDENTVTPKTPIPILQDVQKYSAVANHYRDEIGIISLRKNLKMSFDVFDSNGNHMSESSVPVDFTVDEYSPDIYELNCIDISPNAETSAYLISFRAMDLITYQIKIYLLKYVNGELEFENEIPSSAYIFENKIFLQDHYLIIHAYMNFYGYENFIKVYQLDEDYNFVSEEPITYINVNYYSSVLFTKIHNEKLLIAYFENENLHLLTINQNGDIESNQYIHHCSLSEPQVVTNDEGFVISYKPDYYATKIKVLKFSYEGDLENQFEIDVQNRFKFKTEYINSKYYFFISERWSDYPAKGRYLTFDDNFQQLSENLIYLAPVVSQPLSIITDNNGKIYVIWDDYRVSALYDVDCKCKNQRFSYYYGALFGQLIALENLDTNTTDIPNNFKINVYPNPFNPSATISFSLPIKSDVKISIYNLKGQKIKELTDKNYAVGEHKVVWNGKNRTGKRVSSGVYFYKFEINDKTVAYKKMMLLK